MDTIDEIIEFWFGDGDPEDPANLRMQLWFQGEPGLDDRIREQFGAWIEQAGLGALDSWKDTARGRLAWTLLLDQFTRNAYRDTPRMYIFDILALQSTREAVQRGQDRELPWIQRAFLYLPYQHSEESHAQRESIELYEELADSARNHPMESALVGMLNYAERHAHVVHQFGRFPHRNDLLSRASTDEETRFLASPAAPF